ncbi:low molecular weight phosphotyrosine protein phosphatase 2 [Musca domestica]|uniref:Low molecular weight phosphotyrosine protein phosphatase n=1 Tax=Musca domestica TaxID=7370 RepID=A0ABM3VQD0_MUSDO|nr:low molecular weight phosphotyrosine protein phosphatase 2 [Musca domestica]XP_019893353.2 low molecular weight phosphotyrosine protein phosphatase 2 [Musca domestica]XP_058988003.1 low molecular weight phosphotyrosine protein phosphatase 2 [Musca domestica]
MTKKILMVCMGNICRSPIAEAIMRKALHRQGVDKEWLVDSAALVGYHSGSLPEERALSVLQNHGIQYDKEARVINSNDFVECDYIFGMDNDNVAELKKIAPPDCKARIMLLGDFGLAESEKNIYDPYYFLGEAPFEEVYDKCLIACKAFINNVVLNKHCS